MALARKVIDYLTNVKDPPTWKEYGKTVVNRDVKIRGLLSIAAEALTRNMKEWLWQIGECHGPPTQGPTAQQQKLLEAAVARSTPFSVALGDGRVNFPIAPGEHKPSESNRKRGPQLSNGKQDVVKKPRCEEENHDGKKPRCKDNYDGKKSNIGDCKSNSKKPRCEDNQDGKKRNVDDHKSNGDSGQRTRDSETEDASGQQNKRKSSEPMPNSMKIINLQKRMRSMETIAEKNQKEISDLKIALKEKSDFNKQLQTEITELRERLNTLDAQKKKKR